MAINHGSIFSHNSCGLGLRVTSTDSTIILIRRSYIRLVNSSINSSDPQLFYQMLTRVPSTLENG